MSTKLDRRTFLMRLGKAGLCIGLGGKISSVKSDAIAKEKAPISNNCHYPFKNKPLPEIRIGFIGVGGVGKHHYKNFLNIKGCRIVAVSDILEKRVRFAQNMSKQAGAEEPDAYFSSPYDYKRITERNDIDLIFTATPWKWHVPIAVEAMKCGKHAATEVPAAMTLDECWQMVEVSTATGKHCIMMENCNYDRAEMMILNMVKQGVFGELIHAECGYLHDLRQSKYNMDREGVWRRKWSMEHNGDLYPTHGLGPIAQCLDINRGNYFDYLVSIGSKTRGLHLYATEMFGPNSPQAKEKFKLSDVVTTMIKTKNKETIVVTHDTSNPRPYSRNVLIQGTNGIVRKYPVPRIHIKGRTREHQWEDFYKYKDEYLHPLWKEMGDFAASISLSHGGMDFLEDYRLINALLKGNEPDMDVYDAAVLSAVRPLSEKSINSGSQPVKFPDFTSGLWKKHRKLKVMEMT